MSMLGHTIAYQYIKRTPHQEACDRSIRIENKDCLAVAQTMQRQHGSVCVLNMANQFNVGGDYLTTCKLAQEESLIKRTNLLDSLIRLNGVKNTNNTANPYQYALPNCRSFNPADQHAGFGEFTCLYSPNITVSHLDNHLETPLESPFTVNIISSAAYNLSNLAEALNQDLYLAGTVLKIVNQLRTAKAHDQRHLVLGAFGCGAFSNDPNFIANTYRSALDELEFIGCFDSICFAVTQKQPAGNYDAFVHVFDSALQAPVKPLYHLLMPLFETLATHPILKKMISPFFKINTQEELVYLASKLIQKEIYTLNARQHSSKHQFLSALLDQIQQNPTSGAVILEHALAASEIKTHYPTSRFFKAEPSFLRELNRLLLWHNAETSACDLFPETSRSSECDPVVGGMNA